MELVHAVFVVQCDTMHTSQGKVQCLHDQKVHYIVTHAPKLSFLDMLCCTLNYDESVKYFPIIIRKERSYNLPNCL